MIVTTIIEVIFVGFLVWKAADYYYARRHKTTAVPAVAQVAAAPVVPQIEQVNARYLFSGTTVLARLVQQAAAGNYNQPFSGISSFGKYDSRIMDLECPVTADSFSYGGDQNPRFNCNTKWLPALKKYYDVVKIAGNHTYDMGADGFKATVKNLQAAKIQAVGHYNPHLNKDHNCEVVSLPVRLKSSDGTEKKAALPIAFCAFNYKILFDPEPGEMELIKQYAKEMPVFGMLQAGIEYVPAAGALQHEYARKMIDYGADFVIANGAHYVQDSEAYKGKLIVYSLGNFIFDQADPETGRGLSIAIDMTTKYDDNLAKWITLGKDCHADTRADACLKAAQDQGLEKFKVSLKYEPIAGTSGSKLGTHKGNKAMQQAIQTRLGWPATCKDLIGDVCK